MPNFLKSRFAKLAGILLFLLGTVQPAIGLLRATLDVISEGQTIVEIAPAIGRFSMSLYQNMPLWLNPILMLAGIALIFLSRQGPNAPSPFLTYVDHDFDRDLTSTATYKSKFVVSLINSHKRPIHVLAPSWISQRGDVGLKTDFSAGFWLNRNGKRVDNIPEPTIEPNEAFQIWIGLDETPDLAALQRRKRSMQLGTLRIPIEVNGRKLEPFDRRF